MDYRRIQHFLAAVRHGNLTEAAADLDISQPALSKSIKALEKSVGARLLERGRFGVRPTPYGEALLVRGNAVEAELRNAQSEIDAMKGARRGHVLIGCGPTEANRLLPLAISKLNRSHPDLRITVLYGLNEALMPWVKQGEVDFALSSVPMQASDPELTHERLFIESGAVVARLHHPLAKKRNLSMADLARYPWVLPRRREMERRALDDLFVAHGLQMPDAVVETTSTVLMKSMLMQSDFLTFLPRELIYWELQAGQLATLNLTGPSWTRAVGITRRSRGSINVAGKVLVEALKEAAARFG